LTRYSALRQELAGMEKLLRDHAKSDPVCRQFMTTAMPGVGALVALTFKAAIDDPDRFSSSRGVGPWVGLTPRREQSGNRDIIGGITRAGDVGLRTALYQAATVMLNRGRPNWRSAWAWNVAKTRGKKCASPNALTGFRPMLCTPLGITRRT
jgi:transposase